MMNLVAHIGHQTQITKYGKTAELECLTCRVTIAEQPITQEEVNALIQVHVPEICNLDEGCTSCGS